jgi:hypothetical protein
MKAFKFAPVIYFLITLAIMVGGYLLIRGNAKPETSIKETTKQVATPPVIIDKSLVKEIIYETPDNYTNFKVIYPEFKNTPDTFNQIIADLVNTSIDEHKKDAGGNWQARYETQSKGENIPQYPKEDDKFYFNVSWKPTQENNNYISFLLTISAYSGGAHGYEMLTSFNYDVKNEREIKLADLFPNDANYLKTISDLTRKDLTAQFKKRLNIKTKADEANFKDSVLPMMMDGTSPKEDNFSVFTFTSDKVIIYFNQYQVAPYSMGQSMVILPRK